MDDFPRPHAEDRLRDLGLELPNVPKPIANFVPWRRDGDFIYLAGQICEWNGDVLYRGKVGVEHDLETGRKAARVCGLNLVSALREALGGTLAPVRACVRLGGFVNCALDYGFVPHVVDGASDLMHELFGAEAGRHVRTAVGVATLPQCAAVEVDAIFLAG